MFNRTEFGGRPESCTSHFQLSSSICLLSCQLRGWRCWLVPDKQYGHSLRRPRQQSPQWPTGSPLLSHPSTGVTSKHSSSISLSTTGSLSPSHQVAQTITSKEKSQCSDGSISRKTVFSTYTVIIHKLSPETQPLLPRRPVISFKGQCQYQLSDTFSSPEPTNGKWQVEAIRGVFSDNIKEVKNQSQAPPISKNRVEEVAKGD